jgi:hypothetical protein
MPPKKQKYSEGYHFITIVTNKRVEVFKYKEIATTAVDAYSAEIGRLFRSKSATCSD